MNTEELKRLADRLHDESQDNPEDYRWQASAAILSLIAERDELLEALKGYVTAIANAGGGDKDMFIAAIREADNKARAAIAKAEAS